MRTIIHPLAAAVVLANISLAAPALAQSSDEAIEEVVVTGIKSSLERAMDVKRDSRGVVDAISAEDIGKFPDTNLAESLQRITGVSIDRTRGEGSQVTVRGLGPSFNMVTLNGRQMPAASSPEQESISSAKQSRAFQFEQIGSESVSGVQVYKTARPNVTTGGMGATINVTTARPFDYDETRIVLSGKAIYDSSVVEGDDVTPELAAVFSTVSSDKTWGVLANVSFAERHSSESTAHTDGWLRDEIGSGGYNSWCANYDCTDVPYVYRPVSNIGEIQHNQRQRTNAQLVVQFAPTDSMELTLDYVYSKFENQNDRYGTGLFGDVAANTVTGVELDSNYSLLNAVRANQAADALVYANQLTVVNDSVGLNLVWDVTSSLSLSFDAHSSQAESQPNGELNDALWLIQGPQGNVFDLSYSPTGVDIAVDTSGAFQGTCQYSITDPSGFGSFGPRNGTGAPGGCGTIAVDGFQDPKGFLPLGKALRNIAIDNNVDQFQFEANWELDSMVITGGVSWTDYQVDTLSTGTGFQFQGLAPCADCEVYIEAPSASGAPSAFQVVNRFDVQGFGDATGDSWFGQSNYLGADFGFGVRNEPNFPNSDDELINALPPTYFGASEESFAVYINFDTEFSLGNMPAGLSAGFRYETTDVTGSAFQTFPTSLMIVSNTEGVVNFDPDAVPELYEVNSDYNVFLPAVDFNVEILDGQIVRASYGKSIARPDLNGLRPITAISDYRPGTASAASGNVDLKPYMSDNIDLSYEWYYDDASYFSMAYFYKRVNDYISTSVEIDEILDNNLNPLRDPQGRYVPVGPGETSTVVISEPGDPIAQFEVTRLLNTDERTVDGFELAIQHMFADTGFGIVANYTVVDSDAEFDPNNFTEQSVLIGLSDSANLVGFYENDSFSIRIAGNWRDKFLFATNQLRATNEPVYFDKYLQWDLSASYYITDSVSASFEVLNMNGEDQLQTGRYSSQFLYANTQEPRYSLGIRAEF